MSHASYESFIYAGFWRRFVAMVIDYIVLGVVIGALTVAGFPLLKFAPEGVQAAAAESTRINPNDASGFVVAVIGLLYYTAMECSPLQATLGKLALSLRVTDLAGQRISFLRALGRNAGKFVSWFILGIGYLMAAFTSRKQALHDIMASCVVVARRYYPAWQQTVPPGAPVPPQPPYAQPPGPGTQPYPYGPPQSGPFPPGPYPPQPGPYAPPQPQSYPPQQPAGPHGGTQPPPPEPQQAADRRPPPPGSKS